MVDKNDSATRTNTTSRFVNAGITIAGSLFVVAITSYVSAFGDKIDAIRQAVTADRATLAELRAEMAAARQTVNGYSSRIESNQQAIDSIRVSLASGERYTEEDAARDNKAQEAVTQGLRRDIERLFGLCFKEDPP